MGDEPMHPDWEDAQPAWSSHPPPPFTPEDGYYTAIVSEYMGLQRGGADPFSAALITAALTCCVRSGAS